ncbi:MAG TPA: helix-turn-helix transcriptional regulator [Panacibacter sp.]|nr:helix-turn-helix transcriptional regulator [Panacibacter sp.]HNP45055.1 helix-turn-helix transcriptional regulator [Panacibacter sp.]
MQEKAYADIVPLLNHLCIVLQPVAAARNIKLHFAGGEQAIRIACAAEKILTGFNKLLSTIIDYIPDDNSIYISTDMIEEGKNGYVSVKIRNTGINLKQVPAITNNCGLPAHLRSYSAKETVYEVCFSLSPDIAIDTVKQAAQGGPFNYVNFVGGIKSHFAKLQNPVDKLAGAKPKEAAFFTNINLCILANLEDERFDTNALSDAMAMSRAQLFRRLKSLTGNSPGYYIRTIRLEKAKELLATSDVTISEAAYKTGFNSPSNFTKVFSEKYGITPSQFRRPKNDATNE